ncbi:ParB/RepB/Spo0J family partition protein [Paracidovorax wautersii]|uniref:ParB/RepB/Spo0J family partition protein n=1 Tax=Paracidovorax wautersii TaxID=1177982 RepID=A0A1I2GEV0_9BURK|nr:ParB/RepB/Spo0J family partition protein [Paracidovorax wautersii]SFF15161.1 ParB/RepB/Spo0J family partition protein [Paracidovorax wautersii]
MAAKKTDPLIKRHIRINDDATTPKGQPLPEAGQMGKILGRTPSGRQYQVEVNDRVINLTLDAFTVIQRESDPTPQEVAPAEPMLDLDRLVPSQSNRKTFDPELLQLLAAGIKLVGVLQPLLVRRLPASRLQDTFEDPATRHATHEIIAGERRWRAASIAGLRAVPYREVGADDATALVMQMQENIQRETLTPLDEARGIEELVNKHGYTRQDAADSLGLSLTHVYEAQRLLQLCPEAIAGLQAGTLSRSVALLVAQRPTPALQTEFTRRVLTTGPDGGPLSYRSAKDLANRHYQTDLATAPFRLDDAELSPKAGACMQCPRRTGFEPELFAKGSADVCTDVVCFGQKKEAHFERLAETARKKGRKVITGREAREIMPTDAGAPDGYILLDKPRKGESAPLRQLLGSDVPEEKIVLIETPSGSMVEAIPTRAAGAALESKGKAPEAASPAKGKAAAKDADKGPTAAELSEQYQRRWRRAAIDQIIEGLRVVAEPEALDELPRQVAYRVILTMANETDDETVRRAFQLSPGFSTDTLQAAVASVAGQSQRIQHMVLMMLASGTDDMPLYERPVDEALHIDATAPVAQVDVKAIQAQVQADMKAEAAERAHAAQPQDKAKPTLKPKTSKAEAQAAIAQAMATAETASPNAFEPGQKVRIKTDIKGAGGALVSSKGCEATVVRASGQRHWMVTLPDPWPFPGSEAKPIELVADYTELEAV